MSWIQTFERFTRFKTGRTSINDDERTGRLSSLSRIYRNSLTARRRTILDICNKVGIGYGTCQRIITEEFCMHRIVAKFYFWFTIKNKSELSLVMSLNNLQRTTKTFCKEGWLLATRAGFMVMIQQHSNNQLSGRVWTRQHPRTAGKWKATRRAVHCFDM